MSCRPSRRQPFYFIMKKEKTKIDLYTADGWLNIEAIAALNPWLIVLIGKRQIGKTYGVSKFLLDQDNKFIYLRRTEKELELISQNDDLNPFLALSPAGYNITIEKRGKHGYVIGEYEITEKGDRSVTKVKADAFNLLTLAQMRGFDGSQYTDMVIDEFIPINFISVRQSEGDAVSDIYTTVNGNRELKGEPPLRLWLLANANNIRNPILDALDLVSIIERLMRSQDEYYYKDGIFVAMPDSEVISEKRKQTALMRHLSRKGGRYYQMSVENKFAYNDLHKIKPMSTKGMQPLISIGDIAIYLHTGSLYVNTRAAYGMDKYGTTKEDLLKVQKEYPEIRGLYNLGLIYFESASLMPIFENYFGIKT